MFSFDANSHRCRRTLYPTHKRIHTVSIFGIEKRSAVYEVVFRIGVNTTSYCCVAVGEKQSIGSSGMLHQVDS